MWRSAVFAEMKSRSRDLAGGEALGGEAQHVDLAGAEPAGPRCRGSPPGRGARRARRWISRRAKCAVSPRSIPAPAAPCASEGGLAQLRREAAGELGQVGNVVLAARLADDGARSSVAALSSRSMRSNSAVALARVIVSCATLPACWNASMAASNMVERVVGVGVDEAQPRRVAGDEADEEVDPVLVHVVEPLAPHGERTVGVGVA